MKKSEVSVSMPMTVFEELASYKDRFLELRARIAGLADTAAFDIEPTANVCVSAEKVRALCAECMPSRYRAARLVIVE